MGEETGMTYSQIIDEVRQLPHFRLVACKKCGTTNRTHVLEIYSTCPNCGLRVKVRGFSADGGEVEDVIDEVLAWGAESDHLNEIRKRLKDTD